MEPAASNPTGSKTSLRTVINQVTKEKLAWLDSQRVHLRSHFQPILDKFELPENKGSVQFLREIHVALKACTDGENPALEKTKDLTVFLNWMQIEDPEDVIYFGSEYLVRHWIDTLVKKIKFQIERCEYSCLYANVMSQYMDLNSAEMAEGESEVSESGAELPDKEKTIQEFTERIFKAPDDFSKEEFEKFLNEVLFNMKDPIHTEALRKARVRIQNFSKNFSKNDSICNMDIIHCIDGLLAEDLLGAEKAVTLKELRENDDALNEVTTLLKNRIQNFTSWGWGEPVYVDFRRNMAGRYRAYMDEDIITALLLHYVGAKWSIQFKNCFLQIYSSKMWKRGTNTVGDLYYKQNSIEGYRREFHRQSFLSILPSAMKDLAATGYDDDTRCKRTAPDNNDMTPVKIKQKLLHLISNEVQLNNILKPDNPLTVAQTDMEWFGPSIVHEAIFSLMKFFWVSDPWIEFFKKFLECPLKVGSPSAPVQMRKRGVPLSHLLSSLFGESLLFVMDLYVNQVSGLSLFRIHDDFWFWSHNTELATKAWSGINTFVKIAGLKLNDEKSASVICKNTDPGNAIETTYGPPPLPQRQVKWGFLVLHSDGVFRISEELLEPHVKEMRECLQKSETIMGWVHCHNRYVKFFIRNFADPAITFGKHHIAQIMKALKSILKAVYQEAKGDTVEALKLKFADVWKDKDVMDSWVHWPVQEGGLSLHNPFLDLVPLHEAYRKSEKQNLDAGYTNKFGDVIETDKTEWKRILEESKRRGKRRLANGTPNNVETETVSDLEASDSEDDERPDDTSFGSDDEFPPADNDGGKKRKGDKRGKRGLKRIDYVAWCERHRETSWQRWRNTYCKLLSKIDPEDPQDPNSSTWRECIYSSQLEEKLGVDGGFIDTNMIPLSLISSMQASRVHKN